MKSQARQLLIVILGADVLIGLAIVGIWLINSRGVTTNVPEITSTPQSISGLVVYGTVRNLDGVGVGNVAIFRKYASYEGVLIATTDASGRYQSDFYAIPGDEMVTIIPQQPGLLFIPESCYWRHYYGYEMKACDFSAIPLSLMYLPIVSKAVK